MTDETWQKFYSENPPPLDISQIKTQIIDFCDYHSALGNAVVFITSGGTTVPLEHNTVRFVDNFSAGTRGSASAEYFLKEGFAVIFLHRSKSLEPFARHTSVPDLIESFLPVQKSDGEWSLEVQGDICRKLMPVVKQYNHVLSSRLLLKIEFTTLSNYLHILHAAAHAMKSMRSNAILYLAAAVSDFYIPQENMATHKISSEESLRLTLQLVPKVLQPLVRHWVPEAFVVSFKLETNESILVKKAKLALEKYGHKLVIANELNSRKQKVIFVTKEDEKTILLSNQEIKEGKEIEEYIVKELLIYYNEFKSKISTHS